MATVIIQLDDMAPDEEVRGKDGEVKVQASSNPGFPDNTSAENLTPAQSEALRLIQELSERGSEMKQLEEDEA